ncbi:4562_t:CDS:2 [Funneliformis geosporum]|nr:4562_t:CDS:2 [Funneliformis geosporum]
MTALPFVTIAFIVANVFGVIQLFLRSGSQPGAYPMNTSTDNKPIQDSTSNLQDTPVPTNKALITILSQASEDDIRKYDEQLS